MTAKAKILVVDDQVAVATMMMISANTSRLRSASGFGCREQPCDWLKRRCSI